MKPKILFLFLPFLMLTGCLEDSQSGIALELASDKEDIFAVADIFTGDGELTKTIKISSNRSWSAHLNDLDNPIDESDPSQSVPWASLSVEEHLNVMNVNEDIIDSIFFNRNYSQKQINGVLNIYSEGKLRKSIPLTQAGAKYFLTVDDYQPSLYSDGGGIFSINVVSNVKWRATLDQASTTADIQLMSTEGQDAGKITFRLRSNDDPVEKTVKFIVSADGLEDVPVTVKQKALDPSVKVFNIYAKFGVSGKNRNSVPVVVLATEKMDPEVLAAGARFYYRVGHEGFTEEMVPIAGDPEVPVKAEDGIQFADMNSAFQDIYIDIYGVCDGYRDSYTRIYCRHWRTALDYTEGTGNGLIFTETPEKISVSTLALRNKLQTVGTKSTMSGTACAYYLAHNLTRTPTITFLIDGVSGGSKSYYSEECTSTKPLGIVSSVLPVSEGGLICFETTNQKGPYLYSFASLEQQSFKP